MASSEHRNDLRELVSAAAKKPLSPLPPTPLLRLRQASASQSAICLIHRAHDNEVRAPLAAEGLEHAPKSKHQILRRYKDPFGMRMKWALMRCQFAHIVRGYIERLNFSGVNQLVEVRIKLRMRADSSDVLHQVSSSHIAVIRRIDHSQLRLNRQFGRHLRVVC